MLPNTQGRAIIVDARANPRNHDAACTRAFAANVKSMVMCLVKGLQTTRSQTHVALFVLAGNKVTVVIRPGPVRLVDGDAAVASLQTALATTNAADASAAPCLSMVVDKGSCTSIVVQGAARARGRDTNANLRHTREPQPPTRLTRSLPHATRPGEAGRFLL